MTYTVAVAGKGGVGKSTISALLVRALADKADAVVLAVDADPNANLGEKLGVKVDRTIGDLREDLLKRAEEIAAGGSKQEAVLYQMRLAMVEGDRFDLVTMGRPEGRGCYCYINNMLRTFLDSVMENYPYVVIDNEAGMEHLSRRTCRHMDCLVMVSDATVVGLKTANRIRDLARAMEIDVRSDVLVVNRIKGELDPRLRKMAEDVGFQQIILMPYDQELEMLSVNGESLTRLESSNPVLLLAKGLAASFR
jgi:CO dehydrogenase maturation factor